ncbi:MAG: hypothetical protein ACPG7E_06395 [Marinirhabdus sp.]
MGNISKIVASIENRINTLLHRLGKLQQENTQLKVQVAGLQEQQSVFKTDIAKWRDTAHTLKVANSMLGSNQYKKETKLKINALVREIDHCISQLSE